MTLGAGRIRQQNFTAGSSSMCFATSSLFKRYLRGVSAGVMGLWRDQSSPHSAEINMLNKISVPPRLVLN
jgi:hypothetical protein